MTLSLILRLPQPHIQSALAYVTDRRGIEPCHHLADLSKREPHRNRALQDTAAVLSATALPRNDKRHATALRLRPSQKAEQHGMCLGLRVPVQVEPRVDRIAT